MLTPFQPGVFTLPYPYWHQIGMSVNVTEDEITEACLTQLELLLLQQTAPKDTAAIIIEPVLGEGGYVPAPVKFLQGLRDVCDKFASPSLQTWLVVPDSHAGWQALGMP